MNRRDFLLLSGGAMGGSLLGSELMDVFDSLASAQPSSPILDFSRSDFRIFSNPLLSEVHNLEGQRFGRLTSDRLRNVATKPQVSLRTNEYTSGTIQEVIQLVEEIPAPFRPLAQHSFKKFESVDKPYNEDIIITPTQKVGLIFNPEDFPNVVAKEGEKWDWKGWVGNYFIRASFEKHYVACFNRDVWHIGLTLKERRSNGQVVDLQDWHAAAWRDGWRPCFGLYQSFGRKFCFNVCKMPGWDLIVGIIYAVVAAAVVWWLASAIASAMASVILGGLIAIGV